MIEMNIAFLVNVNYNQIWHRLPTPQPRVSASQTLLTIDQFCDLRGHFK